MILGDYVDGMFERGIRSNERFDDVMRLIRHLGEADLSNGLGGRTSSHAFEVGVAIERALYGLWGIPGIREAEEIV